MLYSQGMDMNREQGRQEMGAKVKGYADGVEYGCVVVVGMSAARRVDNDRYVRGSGYVRVGSPTRAFWLGFRRAMRGQA